MLRSDAPRAEVIGRSEASDACFGLENRRSRIELPRLHVAGCPGTGTGASCDNSGTSSCIRTDNQGLRFQV